MKKTFKYCLILSTISLYKKGISIVQNRNCPNTAKSMEHDIVPKNSVGTGWKPGRLFYNNSEWGNYDNFEIGFANNYCKAVQDAGFIAPYPISIAGKV